jgi:hypothetical protein
MQNSAETAKAVNVGDFLAAVTAGCENYLTSNSGTLLAGLQANGNTPITIYLGPAVAGGAIPAEPVVNVNGVQTALVSPIAGGFLPSSFVAVDGYGQQLELVVKQNPNNSAALSALLVGVGGNTESNSINSQVTERVGASGGYVPTGTSSITGAFGGWGSTTTAWNNIPTAGRPAVTLDFGQAALGVNDYLSRDEIDGNTVANTMNTNILMNGHSILGASTVDTGTLTNSGDTGDAAGSITVGANLAMNNNSIQNASLVQTNTLSSSNDGSITFNNSANLNQNSITAVNTVDAGVIQNNGDTGSGIASGTIEANGILDITKGAQVGGNLDITKSEGNGEIVWTADASQPFLYESDISAVNPGFTFDTYTATASNNALINEPNLTLFSQAGGGFGLTTTGELASLGGFFDTGIVEMSDENSNDVEFLDLVDQQGVKHYAETFNTEGPGFGEPLVSTGQVQLSGSNLDGSPCYQSQAIQNDPDTLHLQRCVAGTWQQIP